MSWMWSWAKSTQNEENDEEEKKDKNPGQSNDVTAAFEAAKESDSSQVLQGSKHNQMYESDDINEALEFSDASEGQRALQFSVPEQLSSPKYVSTTLLSKKNRIFGTISSIKPE